jgi:hypothetical protein
MSDSDLKKEVQAFLTKAETFGMPVTVLRRVTNACSFTVETGPVEGMTRGGTTIALPQSTYDDLRGASPTMRAVISDSVGTLYHEGTHAYLWEKRYIPRLSSAFKDAARYYQGTTLENGARPSDPDQLADEAAASYIDTRINAWWAAFVELNIRIHKSRSNLTVLRSEVAKIRDRFERAMEDTVVGYAEQKRGWLFKSVERLQTKARIPEKLAELLDEEILEHKIRPKFEANMVFMKLLAGAGIDRLPARSATPSPRQPRRFTLALPQFRTNTPLPARSRPQQPWPLQQARWTRDQQQLAQRQNDQRMREQRDREQRLRDQQVRDQRMREQRDREQRLRDQQMRDQRMREQQQLTQRQNEQRTREQRVRDEQQRRERQIRAHPVHGRLHQPERSRPVIPGPGTGWNPARFGFGGGSTPYVQPPGWPKPIPAPPGHRSLGWDRGSKD